MNEANELADFLRAQAKNGDFAHDRERFERAADLLESVTIPAPRKDPAPVAKKDAAPAKQADA